MNKKLRLLVTATCHNRCPLCCNKQFKFDEIPVVDRFDYEEIMITGIQKELRNFVRVFET